MVTYIISFKSLRYWHTPFLHLHYNQLTMSYMALPCIAFTPHHCCHNCITKWATVRQFTVLYYITLCAIVRYSTLLHCHLLFHVTGWTELGDAGQVPRLRAAMLWLWTVSSLPTPCPPESTTEARSPKYSILSPTAKVNTDINNCQNLGFTDGFRTSGKLQKNSQNGWRKFTGFSLVNGNYVSAGVRWVCTSSQ